MKEIKRMNKTGRPVLVGTTSVEQSEFLASQLQKDGTFQSPNLKIVPMQISIAYMYSA